MVNLVTFVISFQSAHDGWFCLISAYGKLCIKISSWTSFNAQERCKMIQHVVPETPIVKINGECGRGTDWDVYLVCATTTSIQTIKDENWILMWWWRSNQLISIPGANDEQLSALVSIYPGFSMFTLSSEAWELPKQGWPTLKTFKVSLITDQSLLMSFKGDELDNICLWNARAAVCCCLFTFCGSSERPELEKRPFNLRQNKDKKMEFGGWPRIQFNFFYPLCG